MAYYDIVGRAFDDASDSYDHETDSNPIRRGMREASLVHLREAFTGAERLLEIGCGTGSEAMELANNGREIVAIDVSQKMVDFTNRKAAESGRDVRAYRMAAAELEKLPKIYGKGYFDGCYSSFGALNCEPSINSVPGNLFNLLKPSAKAVFSVMNKKCLSEILSNFFIMRKSIALRRLRGISTAAVPRGSHNKFDVRLFSPREFETLFNPMFKAMKIAALPLFLPPYMPKLSGLQGPLGICERALASTYPFNCLGDHFLMEMVRS